MLDRNSCPPWSPLPPHRDYVQTGKAGSPGTCILFARDRCLLDKGRGLPRDALAFPSRNTHIHNRPEKEPPLG